MRKALAALATAALLSLLAVPAHAQTYPPSTASVTVSSSSVLAGGTITVAGSGLQPGAHVVVKIFSDAQVLGTTTVAADGSFRLTVAVPPDTDPGVHTLAVFANGVLVGSVTITVLGASAGGLPFTGRDLLPGLWAGTGLIALGAALLLALRHRRTRAAT